MTTSATSTPIRHPWFDQPTTKRKLSVSPVNTNSSSRTSSSSPPKRRKFSALESGFAQLSLNNGYTNTIDTPSHVFISAAGPCISEFVQAPHDFLSTMDADVVPAHDVILPSCVEEPSIPEVKMRSSSWYEPEPDRIVITDLDSSSDEDEGAESPELDTPSISISRPLLEQLSSHAKFINPQFPLRSSSQALVLYRPLWCDPNIDHSKSNEGMFDKIVGEVIEDNSMDVEAW